MTIEVRQIARVETWDGRLVVVGWEQEAACGCRVFEGVRLDDPGKGEPTLGFQPCGEEHEPVIAELRRSMVEDLTDRPLHEVLVERFEAALP